jgi:hypothetical protein
MKSIIAAFTDHNTADQAVSHIMASGYETRGTRILDASNEEAERLAILVRIGVPDDRLQIYNEVIERGGALVVIDAEDDDAPKIAAELDRLGSLDLEEEHVRTSREEDIEGEELPIENPSPSLGELDREARLEELFDVVEEEVSVTEIPHGVRIRAFVTEWPMPIEAADANFTEDEFEVVASAEEPVVQRQGHVVEHVREKEAETHPEHLEEAERRRESEAKPVEDPRPPRR